MKSSLGVIDFHLTVNYQMIWRELVWRPLSLKFSDFPLGCFKRIPQQNWISSAVTPLVSTLLVPCYWISGRWMTTEKTNLHLVYSFSHTTHPIMSRTGVQSPNKHNHKIQDSIHVVFVNTLRDSASFRELSRVIKLKYLHLPSNLVRNIFTLTDNVLELKVNWENI